MARIKQSSVEEALVAADAVELVGAKTQLRRVGSRWVGRCPFHDERTPSFSVNAERKLYHCFGCGRGGDLITFVRETEGLDFVQAVEWLADRYRVQLEYEQGGPDESERRRRERLLALLEAAAVFYQRHLWETGAGKGTRAYLASRGLREEVCRAFRLGLSPGGDVLARKAREKGYTREELALAGLVNRRGGDYFAGRLVFPLADARGRVVGFGARRLSESDPIRAKYVNSPESELFRKNALVYGLDRARAAIAREERAIVVEGYTDVLALHQAGLETAVAAMGTALTERQLRELRRLASRLYLCFDADQAGQEATLRGMELAYRDFPEVLVVALPPGTDPAEAAGGFAARLEAAETYPRHRVRLELERAPTREAAFQRLREVVGGFDRNTEWLDAVKLAADQLDLPRDLQAALAPRASRSTGVVSRKVLEAGERWERDALAGCTVHPELVRMLAELGPEHLDSDLHRRLRHHLVTGEPADVDVIALLAELDARAAAEGIDEETTKQILLRLRERRLRRELATAAPERARELQAQLERIRAAVSGLAER
ncbi:MAG: DNA primase [Thermoleophilia bacterium]|nr:DNA primase [Thermoleophilia bacterium]